MGAKKEEKMKLMQLVIIVGTTLMLAPLANAQKYHALIWDSNSGMTDLGTLGGDTSYALGINDSGEVVGYSYLADNVTRHAFTWTAAGGMVDLGTLRGAHGPKVRRSMHPERFLGKLSTRTGGKSPSFGRRPRAS